MAEAKRQGREKPVKIEQRKVQGPEWGLQGGQIALLPGPICIGQTQGEGKTCKRRSQRARSLALSPRRWRAPALSSQLWAQVRNLADFPAGYEGDSLARFSHCFFLLCFSSLPGLEPSQNPGCLASGPNEAQALMSHCKNSLKNKAIRGGFVRIQREATLQGVGHCRGQGLLPS